LSALTVCPLYVLVGIAAVTDLRWNAIYNWTTYPGLLLGLALRWSDGGWSGLEDALWGALACGGIMLVCYVFFPIGGGDLKLLTMIGAFLGWQRGVEALMWTFVLAGAAGIAMVVWQIGAIAILQRVFRQLRTMWRAKGYVPLTDEDREPLKRTMFLAPAALAAVVMVTWEMWPV
jgi:Flp pilus assembly protein protease CpaA